MTQHQLNLSGDAFAALLQALSALNLTPNGDPASGGSASSATTPANTQAVPSSSSDAPAASTGSNDASAQSAPRGAPAPAVVSAGQPGENWYVIMAGRQVGVFSNWEQVQPLVSGVPHACHKKYKSRAEADEAFETALAEGKVRVI
ncbi:uncharacterized protein EV420DRAFT_1479417 [Desarmillaria tabescens]|uniref:Ribonuclease H1 N-terminal domain-containing protein n=1 Tax=Armillaria tabescens TaxID=1929756 RepID=A0AA39KCN6_ARMTA|nr:uncharacterized protein EV420DRAFT_1479417 [Desarmillaria tabescens]KAK0458721.1 hypothetical protein EV420DRAFT_1479417 [Desarmillaria tabescens]